jgi:carbamoyltransferase
MILCGIKLTHDAAVALIDDGRLLFSIEMEKIGNRPRYSRMDDLAVVFELLEKYGYSPDRVDHYVIDGWRRPTLTKSVYGVEVSIPVGPYRRGLLNGELLQAYRFKAFDLSYLSYSHYAGHVFAAYCSSPFAATGEDVVVLVWDGAMLPYLYLVEGNRCAARSLGSPFYLLGDAYHTVSQYFAPFDAPVESPLGLAGKIMAYTAFGSVDKSLVEFIQAVYERAVAGVVRRNGSPSDLELGEPLGRAILGEVVGELRSVAVPPENMIASWHAFLQDLLAQSVAAALDAHGLKRPKFSFVGGCALNIKWNRALRSSGLFSAMWVPPFPNDAGSAIGAACCAMFHQEGRRGLDWNVYSGPALSPSALEPGWSAERRDVRYLAESLYRDGEPIVVLDGRAELGPRALGNRSILAPATDPSMTAILNRIKQREFYRPVAPICLEHRAHEIFDPGIPDPYMLYDHDVRSEWRSRIPAVCHKDGTSRVQTVAAEDHPLIHKVLVEYERLSGVPVLCNTSANASGCGFFPDLASAMRWGGVGRIWSEGVMYSRIDA